MTKAINNEGRADHRDFETLTVRREGEPRVPSGADGRWDVAGAIEVSHVYLVVGVTQTGFRRSL